MEDWQEWQIRADQIAADLGAEVDNLSASLPEGDVALNARAFWPRFKDLKDRVRTAPAIRLDSKLDLERRLRAIGARAYKAQEVANAASSERKDQILQTIAQQRARAEQEQSPRALRGMRRDFDRLREQFDAGEQLNQADRQAVWDAWREANQFAWQRLTDIWATNENQLRAIIDEGRQQAEQGNAAALRRTIGRFFEVLRSQEAKQEAINEMKVQVDQLRAQVDEIESKAVVAKTPKQTVPAAPVTETWKADLARNREMIGRLRAEVGDLERQVQESTSILDQSMLRGTLAERRSKLNELERLNRALEQKIEQTEEAPLIPSA